MKKAKEKQLKQQLGIESERGETFVGFRPSVINHAKNYTRKQKHKKDYFAE